MMLRFVLAFVSACAPAGLFAEAPDPAKFRVLTLAEFQENKDNVGPLYPTMNADDLHARILEHNAKKLGADGWELCAASAKGVAFRKSKEVKRWDYRVSVLPDSPLNGKDKNTDELHKCFAGNESDGWRVAAVLDDGQFLIWKQPAKAK